MDAVRVIAEPRRQEILRLCWQQERTAGALAAAVDITFGAVSQHLKVLRDADLVTVRRDGTRRYYRAALGPLGTHLKSMWAGQIDRLASLAEAADGEETGGTANAAGTAEAGRTGPSGGPTA